MNLSRAKTILIYAFLGLNLFLCFQLFGEELLNPLRVRVSRNEWRYVEEQLANNGYILETKVDRSVRKSAFLTVSPSATVKETVRKHFNIPATFTTGPGEVHLYMGREAQLRVYPGGLLRVDLTPGFPLLQERAVADETVLVSLTERYLQENGLALAEIRFDHLVRSGKKTVLHYVQIFEGMPLFSGYLKAILENNTLLAVEIYLLEPETPLEEREMEVIPAARALLRLTELLGPSAPPRRIVKADLGFYSREYDAEKWEMPPVWRFLFDNGESCFINAFTGNLEPETSN